MRAIVIATDDINDGVEGAGESRPGSLLTLVDRPFIQHVVEQLIDAGITEFDFVLCHSPEKFESLLGDGTRWGSTFRFHLAKDPTKPYRQLRAITLKGDGPAWLVHANRLAAVRPGAEGLAAGANQTVLFIRRGPSPPADDASARWTGWARLAAETLAGIRPDFDETSLTTFLMQSIARGGTACEVDDFLSAETYGDLLDAQRRVLGGDFPDLALSGREADKGIRLSRNVSLHPTAKLVAPLYVGANCRIGAGVRLGPNAVVGDNCVLDTDCTAADSLVLQGSYVGEALELSEAVVDRNCLISARIGTSFTASDDFILGSLYDRKLRRWAASLLSRLAAVSLLTLVWPLLLLTALWLKLTRGGPVIFRSEAVRLPARGGEGSLRTFKSLSFAGEFDGARRGVVGDVFLRILPGIINIARGEMSFVGVRALGVEEVRCLPHDWRTLYLDSKAGLITEAAVRYGPSPCRDELYSAETVYAVTRGLRHDLKLLTLYFLRGTTGRVGTGEPASERADATTGRSYEPA